MNYEVILNRNLNNNFYKLKYGLDDKTANLEKFMWSYKKDRGRWKKDEPKNREYKIGDKSKLENFLKTGTIDFIKEHTPNTFAIKTQFKLTASYYSSEDDDFYIISNPCIKEHVFKVPMIRGSSWKGALLNGAREIIKEDNNNQIKNLKSYFRIFGVGDDSFRNIVDKVDDNDFKLFFMTSGLAIDINSNVKKIFEQYKKSKAQKGRAIFYPTYFDKLSLELINPHNRKTKAGTNPIYYEVVPKGSEGDLQIVYIPFDGVTKSNNKIEKEAKQDLEFLQECIKRVAQNGIGAKTKLGWGRFEIINKECIWSKR